MAENKLYIFGVSEKARFLDELRNEYGGGIPLRDLQVRYLKKSLNIPIEKCRFTSIDGLSEKNEFTGTIKEIVQNYEMSKKELSTKKIVKWLVKMLTTGDWIPDFNGVEGVSIKCVPIDRKVKELEVKTYLEQLAEEEI